ncbi:hypothetical protein BDZ88DRAFT_510149, partial [Geranomyces variabilis]
MSQQQQPYYYQNNAGGAAPPQGQGTDKGMWMQLVMSNDVSSALVSILAVTLIFLCPLFRLLPTASAGRRVSGAAARVRRATIRSRKSALPSAAGSARKFWVARWKLWTQSRRFWRPAVPSAGAVPAAVPGATASRYLPAAASEEQQRRIDGWMRPRCMLVLLLRLPGLNSSSHAPTFARKIEVMGLPTVAVPILNLPSYHHNSFAPGDSTLAPNLRICVISFLHILLGLFFLFSLYKSTFIWTI